MSSTGQRPDGTLSDLRGGASLARATERALASLDAASVVRRIRDRDHTVWRDDPTEISNRLGWLDVHTSMRDRLAGIQEFADAISDEGVRDVILLGMGGSSLAPEVFRRSFGSAPGRPRLHVLDTTSPAWIRRVSDSLEPGRFHGLVASKSGSTIEVQTLLAHFREVAARGGDAGRHFSAITDPGTALEQQAQSEGFRECFLNDPDIGGRYSALSCFGLVPAAILGVDIVELSARAEQMAAQCLADGPVDGNPGCELGAALAASARRGRNKLTLLASPEIASFGLWIEQLVAESTGKDGVGIVPITDEPFALPVHVGEDRLFVVSRLEGGANEELDRAVRALVAAGQPVVQLDLPDRLALGAEMFRWEFATAVAGHLLEIQPFDQPDVQSTKTSTVRILDALRDGGDVPPVEEGDPLELIRDAASGEYVALMVFGDPTDAVLDAVADFRRAVQDSAGLATTFGIGPRFLHSTGQLHKGGPENGLFLQLLLPEEDLPIPGRGFGFRTLLAAQAAGDLEALQRIGRRAVRFGGEDPLEALRRLTELVRE